MRDGRMRRLILGLVAGMVFLWPCLGLAAPQISAKAAALVDQASGRVLYVKNAWEPMAMASTTKVMTALVAIENAQPDQLVTIMPSCVGIEGSSIYLEAGEKHTVEALLYGLMLRSGNDAAEALALAVGGTREDFIGMMNQKAADLGLSNTAFLNPHGLPEKGGGHYTTALELAKITCAAYEHALFREIVAAKSHTIPWGEREYGRAMRNKNKLLTLYAGGNGVKTGFTKAAGRCLVSGAEREGMQLVGVVLNCPDMWNASMAMLDHGFDTYDAVTVLDPLQPACMLPVQVGQEVVFLQLLPKEELVIPLREGEEPKMELKSCGEAALPIARGQILGYAVVAVDNAAWEIPLVSDRDLTLPEPERLLGDALHRILDGWLVTRQQTD